jgi:hypothetical protein
MKKEVVKGRNGVSAEWLCANIEGDFVVFLIRPAHQPAMGDSQMVPDDAGDAEDDPRARREPRACCCGRRTVRH